MLQSTYRLILAGVVSFTVAAGVAITIVVLATRKDNRGTRAAVKKAPFCCALDDSTTCESFSSACGSNESSCIDCGGDWVSTESMNNVPDEQSKSPSTPTASPPSAAAPSLASSNAPTPIGGGSSEFEYESSPPAFAYNYLANTARPTIAFTVHPTTQQPTFTDQGQSCLQAQTDGRGVAKPLDIPLNANEAVLLARSAAKQLCTLVQVDSGRTRIIPVGRSYQGHRWEPYHTDLIAPVPSFACDPLACSLLLPTLPTGYSYELVAYAHDLPWKDEMARFLEQTTFGPTRKELSEFDDTKEAAVLMASWIKEQQDTVRPSFHREFYRSRLNGRQLLPMIQGLPTQPCDSGVRYRKYAFTELHFFADIEIKTDPATKRKVVYDESGQALTVLKTESLTYSKGNQKKEIADGTYNICQIKPGIGGTWGISVPGAGCPRPEIDGEVIGNPVIFFDDETQPTHPPVTLDGFGFALSSRESFFATTKIRDPSCDLVPPQKGKNHYAMVGIYDGDYWMFDPRNDIQTNTLLNPLLDGGAEAYLQTRLNDNEIENEKGRIHEVACSNVPMTFLNENYCQLSYSSSTCSSRDFPDVPVPLTYESFETMYLATSQLGAEKVRYVYAIEGLQQAPGNVPYDPPCTPGEMSRWVPVDDCTSKNGQIKAQAQSNEIFAELLQEAKDDNRYLRDIVFPSSGKSCQQNDVSRYNLKVSVGGQCWLNVHRMHLQVFDFSSWVDEHPGGKDKIQQFADVTRPDKFRLKFPGNHRMDRFHGWSEDFRTEVGRYGDSIPFSDLPPSLLVEEIAVKLGAVSSLQNTGATVVCGSPGEVHNRVRSGEVGQGAYTNTGKGTEDQRLEIWLALALSAEDQLRQRVAWALSQILVISPGGIGAPITLETESWMVFYDIFVRHAFGNYRDILKEVSYSPMMAKMLTMMNNKSTDYLWRMRRRVEFADENFAREVMQLFSIGLQKLNNDGTAKRGENGETFLTYTNNEITQYARVWTGFRMGPTRGNVESTFGFNYVDPMRVEPDWRDSFPKLGLDQTYVGDGLPLCSDLPASHFLRKGATYVLLGSNPTPRYHDEPSDWSADLSVVRPKLDISNSKLYEKLCQRPKPGWRCKYPSKVVLDAELECYGIECDIQSPRTIEVGDGIYYEYLKPPCAYQTFFSDGQMLKRIGLDKAFSCGDPRQETGGVACCAAKEKRKFDPTFGRFTGERVTFNDAQQLCADAGLGLCEIPSPNCGASPCDRSLEYWSKSSCTVKAKIGLEGTIAIVHDVPGAEERNTIILNQVRQETKAYFNVVWEESVDEGVIDYEDFCERLGCGRDSFDNLCLCNVEVEEDMVFRNAPSREQVLSQLHIGAFPPEFQSGALQSVALDDGVILHSKDGSYSADSIFEVFDDNGIKRFRKNLRSDAIIGSSGDLRLKFRNPPHMISIHDPSVYEIHHETDAALDHYFYHPNLAPFLAIRVAQRFGISNPSPRYVSTAATAFRVGRYIDEATGIRYGTGEYGNMAALVAALLLDREARSVVLDTDPAQGSLLEPFMKFVRMMRSLEFRAKADTVYVDLKDNLISIIGEEPHALPDVFSFFLPEFQPQGAVGNSGLVSPEAEVLTGPNTVNLMNGIFSLVKYGLDSAFGGFGNGRGGGENDRVLGRSNFADGDNRYRPSEGLDSAGVVDELATLLTSGRLSQEKRNLLTTVYDEHKRSEAYINVQQLIATSPEFHTNGLARSSGELRKQPEPTASADDGYKALIEIYLPGGWDSFNVLVPQQCGTKNAAGQTVDAQYRSERGELAMTPREAQYIISVDPADGQPCSKFAIHPDIPILRELWEEGSLLWLANTGVLDSAEINKLNYEEKTVTPLYAHNHMSYQIQVQDPFRTDPGTGLMGRMAEVLTAQGYGAQCMAIDNPSPTMTADSTVKTRPPLVVKSEGATKFNDRPEAEKDFDLEKFMAQLNPESEFYTNAFGETWSHELNLAVSQNNFLMSALENTTLSDEFYAGKGNGYRTGAGMISRLLQTRETRRADRDMVFFRPGFWDHHGNLKLALSNELTELQEGLRGLVADLKYHGLWDDVAIVIASDFGRTLSMNGGEGTDHAWGGHYVLMGGAVKGGRILGKYPSDLTEAGELTVGRGRFIPTTSWDVVWHGIAKWMGVETEEEMREVLPNLHQAHGPGFTSPLEPSDLFHVEADIFN